MSSEQGGYAYRPVDSANGEIRLLYMKYAFTKRGGPLRGSMRTCYLPLSTLPKAQRLKRMAILPNYSALSYVWGDPTLTHEIIVDGKSIRITANLYKALSDMQANALYNFLVWSDAVCICQSDLIERSAQVLLMRDIYRAATSVHIWLEITDKDTEARNCFNVMSKITGGTSSFSWERGPDFKVDSIDDGVDKITEGMYKPFSWMCRAGISFARAGEDVVIAIEGSDEQEPKIIDPEESSIMYRDLVERLNAWRPKARHRRRVQEEHLERAAEYVGTLVSQDWTWFERSWVMQELGVARSPEIVAAGVSLNWDDFLQAAWFLSSICRSGNAHRSRVALAELEMIHHGFSENKRQPLFNLIRACRHRQASDVRDKIFALIGLMGDKFTPYILPNYNIDVREVFARTTLHFLAANRCLDPICGWQTIGRTEGLPSWCPDYALNQDLTMYGSNCMHVSKKLFNASGSDHRGDFAYLDDLHMLEPWYELPVKGLLIDTIGTTSTAFDDLSISHTIALWLSTICSAPELSESRTKIEMARVEEIAGLAEKYETSSRLPDMLFNVLTDHSLSSQYEALEDSQAEVMDMSYVADAFVHCLFSGHIQGNRLRPADIAIMKSLGPGPGNEAENDIFKAIGSALAVGVARRNIVVTNKGLIGTTVEEVTNGDLLCVLFGCSVPVVLRRVEKTGRYLFVGEAYAHGLMDAEAIVMQIKGEVKMEEFVLC